MSELFTGEAISSAMSAASGDSGATANPDPSPAAAGASPAAEGTPTTQAAAADGQATTQADPAQTPKDTTKQGPIPFDVHKTALDNARANVAKEMKAQYAWAEQIPQEHRGTVGSFYALMDQSPVVAAETLIRTIAADPQHAPALRSLFGKLLGNRASSAAPARSATPNNGGAAIPEPDFEDGQGNAFYSAKAMRQALDALERRIDAKYTQKLGPIEQDYRTRQQREADERRDALLKREAGEWAQSEYEEIKTYPHFDKYEVEIGKAMADNPTWSADRAYIRIVLPQLSQQERSEVVAQMQHKANAAAINPSNVPTSAQKPPRTMLEGFQRMGALP